MAKSHKRTAIIIGILGVLYCICPIDAVPDEIPVTGWIDDLVIGGGSLIVAAQLFLQDRIQKTPGLKDITKRTIWIISGFLLAILTIFGIFLYNLLLE